MTGHMATMELQQSLLLLVRRYASMDICINCFLQLNSCACYVCNISMLVFRLAAACAWHSGDRGEIWGGGGKGGVDKGRGVLLQLCNEVVHL